MTLLKVRCRIFSEEEELNPELETGGSVKCRGTISAPHTLKSGRKLLLQMCSHRWREAAMLFDPGDTQGSQNPGMGEEDGGTARIGHGHGREGTLLQPHVPTRRCQMSQLEVSEIIPNIMQKSLE